MIIRLFTPLFALLVLTAATVANESTWFNAPARVQLARDPTLIPKGKGLLFVPAMTKSQDEPSYRILQNGKDIGEARPGTSRLLYPGLYDVRIGSGTIAQMMYKRQIPIVEGKTTLLEPDWSGLVINVIDENRTSINESYELYEDKNQENFGQGFGIEEERGERIRTWLLKPGIYSVLKVGDNFSTTRKFSARLLPGELAELNLVTDDNSQEIIGFYPPTLQRSTAQLTNNWNTQWEFSGSTLFNTSQNTSGQDRSSFAVSTQVHNRSRFSSRQHFASLRLILEEGANKEGNDSFRKSIDNFEVRGTYIYRLSQRIGPYLRGVINTTLFDTDIRFDTPRDFSLLDENDQLIRVVPGATNVTLEPAFSPLVLRQGIGINSRLYRSFPLNVDLRIGFGARQTYVNSFVLSDNQNSASRLKNVTSTGLEALLVLDARLARSINFDSEFDLLTPSRDLDSWVFKWENRLRIFLVKFINIDVVADFEREETLKRLQTRQQVLLRFSKSL
jgi:hypothetical protein